MSLPVHTQTVLVVDDEPDSLRMLTAALEGAELSVLSGGNLGAGCA